MSSVWPFCPNLQKLLLLNLPSAHPGLTAKVICSLAEISWTWGCCPLKFWNPADLCFSRENPCFFVGCLFDGVTCSEASSCHKRQSWKNCSWIFNTSILWLGESCGATFFRGKVLPSGWGGVLWGLAVSGQALWDLEALEALIARVQVSWSWFGNEGGAVVSPRFNPVEVNNL